MSFADHFSRVSAGYAASRPRYPPELFSWISARAPGHDLAWDCATGSGQAAVGLAAHFVRVVATDASAEQISHATAHPRIEYAVAPAEASGLDPASVDVITAAQALHWLPRDRFFDEARRVMKPGGLIAAWGYHVPRLDDPEIDARIQEFHDVTVGPYWPKKRRLVLDRFQTIDFPFVELHAPAFEIRQPLTLDAFGAYLSTQSATDYYRIAHGGADPVPAFLETVERRWGGRQCQRDVIWPLFLRAGRQ